MFLTQKDKDCFWNGVVRGGFDDCWPWLRYCDKNGYGGFKLNGKSELSHRISWFLANGPIPDLFDGLPSEICHRYDNPPCCNPDHLFLGNQLTNQKDSAAKGRKSYSKPWDRGENLLNRGEKHGRAKLTEFQVREIKQYFREKKLTHQQIAGIYGVSRHIIDKINTGKYWSYVK